MLFFGISAYSTAYCKIILRGIIKRYVVLPKLPAKIINPLKGGGMEAEVRCRALVAGGSPHRPRRPDPSRRAPIRPKGRDHRPGASGFLYRAERRQQSLCSLSIVHPSRGGRPDWHSRWSEAVTAFVLLKPGADIAADDLNSHCRDHLGGFEVPKKIVVLETFPMTSTGKIQKALLREAYQSAYAGE